jgi:hypothetical protein
VDFDMNPAGVSLGNELNLTAGMAPVEWTGSDVDPGPGVSTYGPFTVGLTILESTGALGGRVNSFASGGLTGVVLPATGVAYSVGTNSATAPARYRVGQVFFTTTTQVTNDGRDVFAGLFNGVFDLIFDGNGNTVAPGTIVIGTASVNLGPAIPEPGTVALLGLGLVVLFLARRRRRA